MGNSQGPLAQFALHRSSQPGGLLRVLALGRGMRWTGAKLLAPDARI